MSDRELTEDEILYYAESMNDIEELIKLLGLTVEDIVEAFEDRVIEHGAEIVDKVRSMEE
jgi:PHP family Zn ribbon phosphoesterase